MKLFPLLLLVCFCPACRAARAAEEPKISASLGQDEIYEGQSVVYRVVVDNVENPQTPELRGMEDFDVAFLGQQSLDSHQVTIINGVMNEVTHRGREFHFRLTPKKSGEFTIPPPEIKVDGKTLMGEKLRLVVQPPSAQDLAAVELTADRQEVYPTQPFTVTLSVLSRNCRRHSPTAILSRSRSRGPNCGSPGSRTRNCRPACRPRKTGSNGQRKSSTRRAWASASTTWCSTRHSRSSARTVPSPSARSLVSALRRDAKGQEAKYRRYDFPRTFTAKQVGPITLAAVTLQGTFANAVSDTGQLRGKEIYAASKPLAILVKDVPRIGRPESYIGAIGHFRLEAELTPRKSKVGDPITFTLVLSGSGSLAAVKPPDLSKAPAVAARFKVYEATQKTDSDTARFVYSLRPLSEGDEPFPAVSGIVFRRRRRAIRDVAKRSHPDQHYQGRAAFRRADRRVATRGRANVQGTGGPAGRHFCEHHRPQRGPGSKRAAHRVVGRTGRLPGDLPPGGGGYGVHPPADPGQVGPAASSGRPARHASSSAPRRPSGRHGGSARRPIWSRTRLRDWSPTWPACTTPA